MSELAPGISVEWCGLLVTVPRLVSIPSTCHSDGKFEAAWMDSGDEREAAKLSEKPSGHALVLV